MSSENTEQSKANLVNVGSGQETSHSLEREAAHYRKLVFGHDFRRIDIDQMVAYLIMRHGGLVSGSTPVEAVRRVEKADIDDPSIAVLEGINPDKNVVNNSNSGNFVNDPVTDEPAAWVLAQKMRGVIGKTLNNDRERQAQLEDLASWIRANEAPDAVSNPKPPKKALPQELSQLHDILYGIKSYFSRKEELPQMLDAQYAVIEKLFDPQRQQAVQSGDGRQSLLVIYQDEIRANREIKEAEDHMLQEHAKRLNETTGRSELNPDYLRLYTSHEGLQLVFFDVRNTGTDRGAITAAKQAVKTYAGIASVDMIVVISDELDDDGNPIGSKAVVYAPRQAVSRHFNNDLVQALAERLNMAEAQYGRGFEIATEAGFGGHKGGVVGSPQEGTALTPRQLEASLVDYADIPRYTEEQFAHEAAEVAELAGAEKRFTIEIRPPKTAYQAAERVMNLTLAGGEDDMVISISEQELPVYKSLLLTDNSAESRAYNNQVLREKTAFSEHPDARTLRLELAQQAIENHIVTNDGEGVLRLMATLSASDLRSLPISVVMRSYNQICHSSEAIRQLYDPAERRYRYIDANLTALDIDPSSSAFERAIFRFSSVHTIIDGDMVEQIHRYVANVKTTPDTVTEKVQLQRLFAQNMLTLITSESYRNVHQGESHDRLLRNILSYVIDERIDKQVRHDLITHLTSSYGIEMVEHWNSLARANEPALYLAHAMYPQELSLVEHLDPTVQYEAVPGIPRAYARLTSSGEIVRRIQEQREDLPDNLPPAVNLLVQVSTRNAAASLREYGIDRCIQNDDGSFSYHHVEGEIDFDASIITPGHLEIGRNTRQEVALADQVVKQVVELATIIQDQLEPGDQPKTVIRLIRANLPGKVTSAITYKLLAHSLITDEIRKRIVYCDYDGSRKVFEESPFDL